jgi:hypothetical protein
VAKLDGTWQSLGNLALAVWAAWIIIGKNADNGLADLNVFKFKILSKRAWRLTPFAQKSDLSIQVTT